MATPDSELAQLRSAHAALTEDLTRARTFIEQITEELTALAADLTGLAGTDAAAREATNDAAKPCAGQHARAALRQLRSAAAALTGAPLARRNLELAEANRALERRMHDEAAAREDVQAALLRQHKLEALGRLTGGVAHDFNNLLTVVLSGLHMLARADGEPARAQLIERIERAARRGAGLTHRLLAFGRGQAGRPEPFALGLRMAELGELLAHALRGDLRIETRVEDGIWPIEVDAGALELALLNLAVNARDAMPHGGVVTLAARNRPLDEGAARPLGLPAGAYVELSVADRGVGMTPEVLAHAFEPFFSTKERTQGSGLGLAQVRDFARQSGGAAQVESEPGEGCTVRLLLPRGARAPARAAVPAEAEPADGAPAASILVVEDDDEVAALMVDLLAQYGYAATRVSGADAALGALGNGRPLDLLLADVLLPGSFNGVALAREVQRRRPELPIVLTSGYGTEMIRQQIGHIDWPLLRKPFQPEMLRETLRRALRGQLAAG